MSTRRPTPLFQPALALSPDGQTLAFVARPVLTSERFWTCVGSTESAGRTGCRVRTNGAARCFGQMANEFRFFCRWQAEEGGDRRRTRRNACPRSAQGRGAVWAEDDTIVFQPIAAQTVGNGALLRVSAAGGTPEPVTTLAEGEVTQRYPQVLPSGKSFLFTSHIFFPHASRMPTSSWTNLQALAPCTSSVVRRLLCAISAERPSRGTSSTGRSLQRLFDSDRYDLTGRDRFRWLKASLRTRPADSPTTPYRRPAH